MSRPFSHTHTMVSCPIPLTVGFWSGPKIDFIVSFEGKERERERENLRPIGCERRVRHI